METFLMNSNLEVNGFDRRDTDTDANADADADTAPLVFVTTSSTSRNNFLENILRLPRIQLQATMCVWTRKRYKFCDRMLCKPLVLTLPNSRHFFPFNQDDQAFQEAAEAGSGTNHLEVLRPVVQRLGPHAQEEGHAQR